MDLHRTIPSSLATLVALVLCWDNACSLHSAETAAAGSGAVPNRTAPSESVFDQPHDEWLVHSASDRVDQDSIVLLRHDPATSKVAVIAIGDSDEGRAFIRDDNFDSSSDFSESVTVPMGLCSEATKWQAMDTLSIFGGLEGSKQPQDFGVNANFGGRWAANWGFPLLADYGIGGQVGSSVNYTDNAVQVFERVGATSQRTQNFTTLGVFQRTDTWRWGLAYDVLYESYYDQFLLGQWRGRVGYATSIKNEFGVWFAVPQQHSNGSFLTIPVQLTPLAQGSCYWQHLFSAGTRTMFWAGVAQGHAETNLALGDLKRTGSQFVFGAEIDVPLNNYFSIYGQANFISPADTGTVDSFLGVSYYPGGQAFPITRNAFTPFQALANSTMMALDLRRN